MTDAMPQAVESNVPQLTPRARLMDAATRLFCKNGINATGIDAIVSEAGTAKTTLYKNFKSKDDLVDAVLRAESETWRGWFIAAVERAKTPREKLDAIFPALKSWFAEETYYGCVFINAVGEHSKDETRLRDITIRHKSFILKHISGLAEAAGAKKPDFLAHQIGLLMDGAIVADAAGMAANALLDEACGPPKIRRTRRAGLQGGAAALAKEDLSVVD
jgi:AcrR family transcriptional regulator